VHLIAAGQKVIQRLGALKQEKVQAQEMDKGKKKFHEEVNYLERKEGTEMRNWAVECASRLPDTM